MPSVDGDLIHPLLTGAYYATLVTLMPDGMPQASVVWCQPTDGYLCAVMDIDSQKYRNLKRNPRATFMVIASKSAFHYVEVRGQVVEFAYDGVHDWLDEVSIVYTGKKYFGGIVSEARREKPMVLIKVEPQRIRVHGSPRS